MLPRSLEGGIEREFIVRKLSINGTTFVSTSNQRNGVQTIFTKQFGDDKNNDFQLARHGTISFSGALRQCPLWCGAAYAALPGSKQPCQCSWAGCVFT